MKYKALCLAATLPLFTGCEVIFDPPTAPPEKVSGLTYEDMRSFGRME